MIKKTFSPALILIFLNLCFSLFILSDCDDSSADRRETHEYTSYIEIPGVTNEEILAIEKIKEQYDHFIYGVLPSTEAFVDNRGQISGWSKLFCGWLTTLFNVPFTPRLVEWDQFLAKLESYEVDFTGAMTATAERRRHYFMTTAIAAQAVRSFRLVNSSPLEIIVQTRPIRYVFIEGTTTIDEVVATFKNDRYEILFADSIDEVHQMLVSGEADLFINANTAEASFDEYGDVIAKDFLPLLYSPVSLTTQNPHLEPFISVVQKALDAGVVNYLTTLYNQGELEYRKQKLFVQLTSEERDYVNTHSVIPYAAEHDNYPVSFYNIYEKDWQGAAMYVLNEVSQLTGFSFTRVNDMTQELNDLINKVESGEAAFITELVYLPELNGRFIWPQENLMFDNYALISRRDYPYIKINEVLYLKAGLVKNTANAALFREWFREHARISEYENYNQAFSALSRGDVDIVMASQNLLLMLTNFREQAGYKANIMFDRTFDVKFGFNKDREILCSIFDKAFRLIDTEGISGHWLRRTYDYRVSVVRAQIPWLIGVSILLLCVLLLLFYLLQRKRHEEKILESIVKKRTKEAEAANHAKSAFLANMSHEIRTPINAIIGMTKICKNADSIERKDYALGRIENASTHLLGVLNEVLDISKIEAGRLDLSPVEFNFKKTLKKITAIINFRMEEKKQELSVNIDPYIPEILVGDDQRLSQVIMNLLSNSIKFTPEKGGIRLDAALIEEIDGNCRIRVEVSDTGIGISPEQQERLFTAFGQAESGTNRKYGGTGLGLVISKRIIELMGGKLWVESELGKGAKFIFTALVQRGRDTNAAFQQTAGQMDDSKSMWSKNEFMGKRLLLVEDIDINREIVITLLEDTGLIIDIAENGKDAVEKIAVSHAQYDMILMDIQMPVMDGYEASHLIRLLEDDLIIEHKRLPIIAMTANVFKEDIDACLAAGMDGHIGKPFEIPEVYAVLKKYIRENKNF